MSAFEGAKIKPSREEFSCIPAREGLAVIVDADRCYCLPDPNAEDKLLAQPELPIRLASEHLRELLHPLRPVAVTRYGPEDIQDKASNQDFALSARIEDGRSQVWNFSAVADGVSTLTFWPERASRIACLVAYRFLREKILHESLGWEEFRDHLRSGLAKELQRQLDADRIELLRHSEIIPSTYSAAEYRKHQEDPTLWYNTTLLVSIFGPYGGLLLWAGDGGIWLRKTRSDSPVPEVKEHLRSGDSVEIDQFVSLAVCGGDFKGGQIELSSYASVALFLASDGFDRTLSLQGRAYSEFLPESPAEARRALPALHDGLYSTGKLEPDNSSLTFSSWPPERFEGATFELPKPRPALQATSEDLGPEREPEGEPTDDLSKPSPEPRRAGSAPVKSSPLPARTAIFLLGLGTGLLLVYLLGASGDSEKSVVGPATGARGSSKPAQAAFEADMPAEAVLAEASLPLVLTFLEEGGAGLEGDLAGAAVESLSLANLGDLRQWARGLEVQGTKQDEAVTVVAYARPEGETVEESCRDLRHRLARSAQLFADLFAKISLGRYRVRAGSVPCLPPPGMEGLQANQALTLGLVRSRAESVDPCLGKSFQCPENPDAVE